MRKQHRIVFLIVFISATAALLSGCAISWIWGGTRYTPEDAMEAVGVGHSKQERIEADGCYFYYQTVSEFFENPGQIGQWLYTVTPVRKNEAGMWYASPDPRSYIVKTEDGTAVGSIIPLEVNGNYHNFFIPEYVGNESVSLPDALPGNYESVVVDGNGIELYKHCYFVTKQEVRAFEIGDVKLLVSG